MFVRSLISLFIVRPIINLYICQSSSILVGFNQEWFGCSQHVESLTYLTDIIPFDMNPRSEDKQYLET